MTSRERQAIEHRGNLYDEFEAIATEDLPNDEVEVVRLAFEVLPQYEADGGYAPAWKWLLQIATCTQKNKVVKAILQLRPEGAVFALGMAVSSASIDTVRTVLETSGIFWDIDTLFGSCHAYGNHIDLKKHQWVKDMKTFDLLKTWALEKCNGVYSFRFINTTVERATKDDVDAALKEQDSFRQKYEQPHIKLLRKWLYP